MDAANGKKRALQDEDQTAKKAKPVGPAAPEALLVKMLFAFGENVKAVPKQVLGLGGAFESEDEGGFTFDEI